MMKKTKDGFKYSPSFLIYLIEPSFSSWMDRYDFEIPDKRQSDHEDSQGKLVMDAGNRQGENFLHQLRGVGTDLSEIEQGKDTSQKTSEAIASNRELNFQAACESDDSFPLGKLGKKSSELRLSAQPAPHELGGPTGTDPGGADRRFANRPETNRFSRGNGRSRSAWEIILMRTNTVVGTLLLVILSGSHALIGSTQGPKSPKNDANLSISPIIRMVDQNLLNMHGESYQRTKQYIGLCILADWCPASRSFARHISDFHNLFGDEVTLVLVNPGKRSDWFFGRYRIPWKTVRSSALASLLDQLQIKHAPKFILMDEQGKLYDRTNWKRDYFKF